MINKFDGKYRFLSNFYDVDITIKGRLYKSLEHAYQSFKCTKESEHEWIRLSPDATKAKYFGKKVKVRNNWDNVKYDLMLKLVRLKFKNEELRQLLLETGNEELVEGNYWHDNYFGVCSCEKCKNIEKKNLLGKILMIVRQEINDEIELFK